MNNEKNIDLFLRQKDTLDKFLERGAISQAQYDKSYGDLVVKMGMEEVAKRSNSHGEGYKSKEKEMQQNVVNRIEIKKSKLMKHGWIYKPAYED